VWTGTLIRQRVKYVVLCCSLRHRGKDRVLICLFTGASLVYCLKS